MVWKCSVERVCRMDDGGMLSSRGVKEEYRKATLQGRWS